MMEDHLFDLSDGGYTALHWAAQSGQLSMVEYLVKSCGFDLKAKDKVGILTIFDHSMTVTVAFLLST